MTSTQLIGRETMISRLVFFHNERIERVYSKNTIDYINNKKSFFTYNEYNKKSTQQICKEYDLTFGELDINFNVID